MGKPDDFQLQQSILQQLDWARALGTHIEVDAKDGAVLLTGYAHGYAVKIAAGECAGSVPGVRSVTNDIQMEPMIRREHYSPEAEQMREHIRTRTMVANFK